MDQSLEFKLLTSEVIDINLWFSHIFLPFHNWRFFCFVTRFWQKDIIMSVLWVSNHNLTESCNHDSVNTVIWKPLKGGLIYSTTLCIYVLASLLKLRCLVCLLMAWRDNLPVEFWWIKSLFDSHQSIDRNSEGWKFCLFCLLDTVLYLTYFTVVYFSASFNLISDFWLHVYSYLTYLPSYLASRHSLLYCTYLARVICTLV